MQPKIIIISGGGDRGFLATYTGKDTARAIKYRLTRERSKGARWAAAYRYQHKNHIGQYIYYEIDGGHVVAIEPRELESL